MKRRILSFILVTVMLFITLSVGFSASSEAENLIKNGDFAEISNNLPTNWKTNLESGTTAEVVKNVSVASGLNTTAMKFTTTTTSTSRSEFYYTGRVKIEKNTTYTTTFWVKSSTIAGFRAYMYEPTYINTSGAEKTSATAIEGQNIYTYSFSSGSTRVIRTDVGHNWTIKETGTLIDKQAPSSMVIFRSSGVTKLPAVDYPNETRAGEWVQIQHTFKTGNDASHEAEISYSFAFPSVENGDFWIADVIMTAQKEVIDTTFTPTVNDPTLGTVSPSGAIELVKGTPTTITAEPFGENTFNGWYLNGVCVSTEPVLTFTYNGGAVPQYEARFTKAEWGIDVSFETDYTNGQTLAQQDNNLNYNSTDTEGLWTEDLFKSTSKDGNNKFFIDSQWSKFGKAIATTAQAHTGAFSLKMSPNARFIGYKFEKLTKNTDYTVSFYAMTLGTTDNTSSTVGEIIVTDADKSCIVKNSDNKLLNITEETGALAKTSGSGINFKGAWKNFSIEFNSKESTDVIVWICPMGAGTQLYLDNYSIKRAPKKFKPVSNNIRLGTVTPDDFIECRDGQSVTVTAKPYPNVNFIGWYVGDELISEELNLTFKYEDKYQGLTAVFEAIPGIITKDHFENYENGQILASYNNNSTPKFNSTPPWSVDTAYRTDIALKLTVTNALAYSGEKSLLANIPYRYTGLDIEGLKPHTEYTVSFYAHITGETPSSSYRDQTPYIISDAFILPKGKAVIETINSNGNVSYKGISSNEYLASIPKSVECLNEWKKIEIPFTTTNLTDITLWLTFGGYKAQLYMDDFQIFEAVKVTVKAERGGKVTTNYDSENVPVGKFFTATAIPYEGSTFMGWYDEKGVLISTALEYSFTVTEEAFVSARFDGKNMPEEDLLAQRGYDGTFESGTVNGWYFYDPDYTVAWCYARKTSNQAYEGDYSLAINSRYRVTVLPLENLYAHTNYTLSFYVKFSASDAKAEIPYVAVLPHNVLTPESSEKVFDIDDTLAPSDEWQKVELSFNSESCTSMNFVLQFKTDSTSQSDYLFIDNLTLTCKEYTGPDHNIRFTPGNINGDGNNSVNLLDLVTLARYVAGWENLAADTKALDVNADSLVNLEDVTYLSRYLAGWKNIVLSQAPYLPSSK